MFYEVGVEHLPLYIDLGLTLLKLGEEARVPLADFSLDGPSRRGLRRTQRQMERDGVTFEVMSGERGAAAAARLRAISDAWLATRSGRARRASRSAASTRPTSPRFPVGGRAAGTARSSPSPTCGRGDTKELSVDLMRYSAGRPGGVDGLSLHRD